MMENQRKLYAVKCKPMSVNKLYTGRRYKTPEYKSYFDELYYKLPPLVDFDRGLDLEIHLVAGMSNRRQDLDNIAKAAIDVMQKKYDFNDCQVMKLVMEKEIVPRGEEFLKFNIINITE